MNPFDQWVCEVAAVLGCHPIQLVDYDKQTFDQSWRTPGLRSMQTLYNTGASPKEAADVVLMGGV
jgi:hypothetical protein